MTSADLVPSLGTGMAIITEMQRCLNAGESWTNHKGVVFQGEALQAEFDRYFTHWQDKLRQYQTLRDAENAAIAEKERALREAKREQGRMEL